MMEKRIYYVFVSVDGQGTTAKEYLVRAGNKAQAEKHVRNIHIEASVATPEQLIDLTKVGVNVVNASGD
jgi:hypothetical protein